MSQEFYTVILGFIELQQPAFLQFMEIAVKRMKGQSFVTNGFNILIKGARLTGSELHDSAIKQSFLLDLDMEKAQGWMPLKIDSRVLVDMTWTIINQKQYPAIQIHNLKFSSNDKTKLGILNFSLGVPHVIRKKVLNQLAGKKQEIQNVINQTIRKYAQIQLAKSHKLQLPNNKTSFKSLYLNLKELQWDVKPGPNSIGMSHALSLSMTAIKPEINLEEFSIAHLNSSRDMLDASLKVDLPYDLFHEMMADVSLPLGKLGSSKIMSAIIQPHSTAQASMKLRLHGDLNGALDFKVRLNFEEENKLSVENLQINLENKLLDFGASLFESKIENKIVQVLNSSLNNALSKLELNINNWLEDHSDFITIRNLDKFSWSAFKIALLWKQDHLQVSFKNSDAMAIVIKSIPGYMLK